MARPRALDRLGVVGRRLRRLVLARRRLLAGLCAGLAVLAGLRTVTAPPPQAVPVVVATHDLPAGHRVGRGDVRTVGFAPGTEPAGDVPDPVGRTLASPLRTGEPVTDARLLGAGLSRASPGQVPMPVRLSDAAMAALLRIGDRVDLIAADPQGGSALVLARSTLVLAIPAPDSSGAPSADGLPGRLVVLAVPPADVTSVSGASVAHFLTFAWSQ